MNNKLTLKVKLLIFWFSLKSPFNKNVFVELNKMTGSWVMVVIAFIVMYFYYMPNRYRHMKEYYIQKREQYINQLKIIN